MFFCVSKSLIEYTLYKVYSINDLVFTEIDIVNYGGENITDYQYTAEKHCELHVTFKLPKGLMQTIIRLNGIIIGNIGFSWSQNTEEIFLPWSITLNKGDIISLESIDGNYTAKAICFIITILK